jgi:hypothetical protein
MPTKDKAKTHHQKPDCKKLTTTNNVKLKRKEKVF